MAQPATLEPAFVPQVEQVVMSARDLGVAVTVTNMQRPQHQGALPADRFTLSIPYGASNVAVDVMFDAMDPESPPDFIFDGADNPTFDLESMPTLCRDWDLADDRCLWHAVEELLVAFRARATAVVVERGVKKLIDDLSAVNDANNVEVSAQVEGGAFVMTVVAPLSELASVKGMQPVKDGHRTALSVKYTVRGSQLSLACTLMAPPHLPISGAMALPKWLPGTNLKSYIPAVIELIHKKWTARHDLMAGLEGLYPDRLEYDDTDFGLVSFVAKISNGVAGSGASSSGSGTDPFGCIVKVTMSPDFPQQCPRLDIQAMVTGVHGTAPTTVLASGYPYSPRWSGGEMAVRLQSVIIDRMQALQAQIAAGTA